MKKQKHLWINGARAEVLNDEWIAMMQRSGDCTGFRVAVNQRKESITKKERDAICKDADNLGYDTVVVERHIHAKYDLRCTMSARSGTRVYTIRYDRAADGRWVESRSSRSSFY